jgi:hypothetical protein
VSGLEQPFAQIAADESSSTCDKDAHI